MSALAPYFHTTSQISKELKELSTNCPGMSFTTKSKGSLLGKGTNIDVVTIRHPDAKPVNKFFMLFGEHARELISPETGLHLVKTLCGKTDLSARAKGVLMNTEFMIINNANPHSRENVEQGDFCLRVNSNGVDLNRNWDEKWSPEANEMSPVDTNPGPSPFSEPETQIFRELVTAYDPTSFLTVHSGTRGLYMPWAWDTADIADRNQENMVNVLQTLDKSFCECPMGGAGKEVGYACPGTCLDWIYEKLQTPYAFAFEIYAHPQNDANLKQRYTEQMEAASSFAKKVNATHLAHDTSFFASHPSDFVQMRADAKREVELQRIAEEQGPTSCFDVFNPDTEEKYNWSLNNWVNAYLNMAELVVADLDKKGKVEMGNPAVDVGTAALSNTSSAAGITVLVHNATHAAQLAGAVVLPNIGMQ